MENLSKLFKLMELTRAQPQYGYALAGIRKQDLSDLAQHHYLVSFMAWQLARGAAQAGIKVDILKVLELSLLHDLGELLGGDISMPYARINPKARKLAKAFEAENQRFLAKFFPKKDQGYYRALVKEVMDTKLSEGFIVKVADIIEAVHYRLFMKKLEGRTWILMLKS
ncbi:MAG: HD domain-containing protein [Patescibacteria group bacterium]|nr:HD domain-containing protein [Patescibacteria group bacterium]